MSNYRDFVQDFPTRCRDVLLAFSECAGQQDREVTLLLMATTAGFIMPYERLSEGDTIKQPTLDRSRFAQASKELKGLLAKTIRESGLFDGPQESWRGGPLQSASGMPDEWPECREPQSLSPDTLVADVVRPLRNALAHGNVFTRGNRTNQISELIFVCGGTLRNGRQIPLRFVLTSPTDLRYFLDGWFKFVGDLGLPHHIVLELVDEAA